MVCHYMDDIIYMGSCQTITEELKCGMMKVFDMTDLGPLHYFLGLDVIQGEDGIFLPKRKYAEYLVKRFSLQGCKPATTPMNIAEKLQLEDGTGNSDVQKY